jgi:hypothetical protein
MFATKDYLPGTVLANSVNLILRKQSSACNSEVLELKSQFGVDYSIH